MELRIFGPPGTGKTTRLARRASVAAEKFGASNVMVSSFTRAAAAELVSRDLPLPKENVGTLHALCWRALERPEIAEPHAAEFSAAHQLFRLSRVGADLDEPAHDRKLWSDADKLLLAYNRLRALMVERAAWPASVAGFAAAWEGWKREAGYLDFTDLIEHCLLDTRGAPGAPKVGLFDEAQDFTRLQTALIRKWAASMDHVLLCGDDDQLLYGWIGASVDAFLEPPLPEAHTEVLAQSYRVPRAVHALAARWITQVARRYPKVYLPRDAEGEVTAPSATWRAPEPLLSEIEAALAAGETIMVLAACGYMLEPVIQMLRRHGLPYHNPYRKKRGDWNPLATRKGAVGAAERLYYYLRPLWEIDGARARVWSVSALSLWVEHLKAEEVLVRGLKARLADLRSADTPREARAWIARVAEILAPEALGALSAMLDQGVPELAWFRDRLLTSRAASYEFPWAVATARGPEALTATPSVIVGTIHSVKGGEADRVVLFPDLSLQGFAEWQRAGSEGHDAVARQFYVGLTRARRKLILTAPAGELAVRGLVKGTDDERRIE